MAALDFGSPCTRCGHPALDHHGVDKMDGCLFGSRFYPCACNLTATEAAESAALSRARVITRAEALAERDALLAGLGMPLTTAREAAGRFELDARQRVTLGQIEDLDWLAPL